MVAVNLRLPLCAAALAVAATPRAPRAAGRAVAAIACAPGAASAAAPAACADPSVPGGDWPSYGHDASNSRSQPNEKVVSPADVPLLSPAWTFSTKKAGASGDVTGTPV